MRILNHKNLTFESSAGKRDQSLGGSVKTIKKCLKQICTVPHEYLEFHERYKMKYRNKVFGPPEPNSPDESNLPKIIRK